MPQPWHRVGRCDPDQVCWVGRFSRMECESIWVSIINWRSGHQYQCRISMWDDQISDEPGPKTVPTTHATRGSDGDYQIGGRFSIIQWNQSNNKSNSTTNGFISNIPSKRLKSWQSTQIVSENLGLDFEYLTYYSCCRALFEILSINLHD